MAKSLTIAYTGIANRIFSKILGITICCSVSSIGSGVPRKLKVIAEKLWLISVPKNAVTIVTY